MSKSTFSLHSITEKAVFQLNRESAAAKLEGVGLTTTQILENLGHLYNAARKASGEVDEMRNNLAGRLAVEKFGLSNRKLDTSLLENFVRNNPLVFQWFKDAYPDIARMLEAGLAERKQSQRNLYQRITAPPSNDNEIHELKEQLRQLQALVNKPKRTYKRSNVAKDKKQHKKQKQRVDPEPEPQIEEYSKAEESDGS
ncbi:hypothetical protein HK104_005108, partial [Borealophlyctis nickersoniae]